MILAHPYKMKDPAWVVCPGWKVCLAGLVLALLASFCQATRAADVSGLFASANRLYAEGKFSEAATAYQKIASQQGISANLLFNLGNAEFKCGMLGPAIAAFSQAELLAPRDAEIRANLKFVRSQAQDSGLPVAWWQEWLGLLSLNEWTLLWASGFWVGCALFVARQIHPRRAPFLRLPARLAFTVMILAGTVAAVQAVRHYGFPFAVVTSPSAVARSGPFEDAQEVFNTRSGSEYQTLDQHQDWVLVRDHSGKIGWLNQSQVQLVPPT